MSASNSVASPAVAFVSRARVMIKFHQSRLMTPPRVPPGQNLSRDGWDARPTPSPYPSEKARASSSRSSAIDSPRAITSAIARGRSRDIPRETRALETRARNARGTRA